MLLKPSLLSETRALADLSSAAIRQRLLENTSLCLDVPRWLEMVTTNNEHYQQPATSTCVNATSTPKQASMNRTLATSVDPKDICIEYAQFSSQLA